MIFKKGNYLKGSIVGIPSKSYAHRALIAAGLSDRTSIIKNVEYSKDILATIDILKSLGIDVCCEKNSIVVKKKNGYKDNTFDCVESGTTLRMMIPVISALGVSGEFIGKGKLPERPIDEYIKIFDKQKIEYEYLKKLPLKINGKLRPDNFLIDCSITSQYLSGLLMALPLLDGDSTIKIVGDFTSKSYSDITLDVLKEFGILIDKKSDTEFYIRGNQKYIAREYTVENDFSQVAFWIVGGTLNGEICIENMNMNSIQGDLEIIEIVNNMGGNVVTKGNKIFVNKSETFGIDIDAENIPDLVPIIAVLAAVSKGKTNIHNISRLKYKESDRGKATMLELNKLGAKINIEDNKMVIDGVDELKPALVYSRNDHRIAMSLAIASLKATDNVAIERFDAVDKSYPNFIEDFKKLGGKIIE